MSLNLAQNLIISAVPRIVRVRQRRANAIISIERADVVARVRDISCDIYFTYRGRAIAKLGSYVDLLTAVGSANHLAKLYEVPTDDEDSPADITIVSTMQERSLALIEPRDRRGSLRCFDDNHALAEALDAEWPPITSKWTSSAGSDVWICEQSFHADSTAYVANALRANATPTSSTHADEMVRKAFTDLPAIAASLGTAA